MIVGCTYLPPLRRMIPASREFQMEEVCVFSMPITYSTPPDMNHKLPIQNIR
jgi:hypothetical protein